MEKHLRCAKHKERAELPRLCHTCQRIDVEREIVTRTVKAMLAAGYALGTDAEGEGEKLPTADEAEILERLMEVDDEHLLVFANDGQTAEHFAWVYFVYGNDGWDVINDYTMNLEGALMAVNTYAESLS